MHFQVQKVFSFVSAEAPGTNSEFRRGVQMTLLPGESAEQQCPAAQGVREAKPV